MTDEIYTNQQVKDLTSKILPELGDFYLQQSRKAIKIGYHDPVDLIKPYDDILLFQKKMKYANWRFDQDKNWFFEGVTHS